MIVKNSVLFLAYIILVESVRISLDKSRLKSHVISLIKTGVDAYINRIFLERFEKAMKN